MSPQSQMLISGELSNAKKRVFVEEVADDDDEEDDDGQSVSKRPPSDNLAPIKHWQVGEMCQAMWIKDGQ